MVGVGFMGFLVGPLALGEGFTKPGGLPGLPGGGGFFFPQISDPLNPLGGWGDGLGRGVWVFPFWGPPGGGPPRQGVG